MGASDNPGPRDDDPRWMARFGTIFAGQAASPISLALAGPIADWIGIRAWFGLSAVASLLITLYFGGSRRLRDFDAGDAMTERRDETTGAPSGAVV
jgi:hypothetical protein